MNVTLSATQDNLEHTLLQAHSLIELAVSRYRTRETSDLTVKISPDSQATIAAAEELARNARSELAAVVRQQYMSTSMNGLQVINGSLARLVRKGVRVRLLCSPETMSVTQEQKFINSAGPEMPIRVAECPPEELLIVDGHSAIIRNTMPQSGHAIILHDPAIVNSIHTLFNSVWALASPVIRRKGPWDSQRELESRVLICLFQGQTDEAAAREMGISVRTYRRYVAKIMQDMGVSSRFQAGALASRLGLISAAPARGS